jgi:hypothetical protein
MTRGALAWLALLVSCKSAAVSAPAHLEPADGPLSPLASGGATQPVPSPASASAARTGSDAGPAVFAVEEGERLVATWGTTRQAVIDLPKRIPPDRFGDADESFDLYVAVELEASGDFEHDQSREALVGLSMGGNACPGPTYVLARAAGGRVTLSETFGGCSGPVRVVRGASKDEFVVAGLDESHRFQPVAGTVREVEKHPLTALQAEPVIAYDDAKKPGGHKTVRVDLDGDGKPDTIDCTALRFLTCSIRSANGSDWGTLIAPERLGVLPQRTRGHRDLVVGPQTVVQWNGHAY